MATFEYNAIASTSKFMKRTFVWFVILLLAGVAVDVRSQQGKGRSKNPLVAELTLHPAKAAKSAKKYRLLPRPEEQSDTDAVPLYEKAVQSLPKNFQTKQIYQWAKAPPNQLPRQQVQSTLEKLKASLQLVEQAARCRKCQWPDENKYEKNLSSYRKLAYVLALQARLQIAEGNYDEAIGVMQTGLTMGNHIGQGPTIIQGLVGVAIGGLMCRQLEQFVQVPDAPNLYWALRDLPKPLVDLTVEWEPHSIPKRVHMLMNRLDRHVATLQCVEALRLYVGSHDGKFPNELSEITQVTIPSDPVSKKPFIYHRTGSEAVLEGPPVEGIKSEDMISYKITLKE